MATKKKLSLVSLTSLRRLAKDAYGAHAQVSEERVPSMRIQGQKETRLRVFTEPFPEALTDERILVCHPNKAVARHALKGALWTVVALARAIAKRKGRM